VTVVEADGASTRVIAFDGERLLGGLDWDRQIANWFRQKLSDEQGVDLPMDDLVLTQQLMQRADEAKQHLSRLKKTLLAVEFQGKSYALELTAGELEAITKHLLEATIEKTRAVLEVASKKGITKIDKLLLVGGSSRMPAVARRLHEETKLEPILHDPDQAVEKGAALLARLIQNGEFRVDMTGKADIASSESRLITMLTPKSLGIEAYDPKTQRDIVRYLVPKNSELPAKGSSTFGTYEENQQHINAKIYEERGEESENPEENTLLHETPVDLPPGLRAGSPIEVTFRVDDAGVLHVFLKELRSGKTWEIKVEFGSKRRSGRL
jgi:molecular chaperone DnaK